MSLPDDDDMKRNNVVRLGNETLFAIADELRRMYDADVRSNRFERDVANVATSFPGFVQTARSVGLQIDAL